MILTGEGGAGLLIRDANLSARPTGEETGSSGISLEDSLHPFCRRARSVDSVGRGEKGGGPAGGMISR